MRSICHSESDIHLTMYGDYIFYINKGTNYVVVQYFLSQSLTKKINIVMLMLFIRINLLSVFICYNYSLSVLELFLCLLTIAISFYAFVITQRFLSCLYQTSFMYWIWNQFV